MVLGGLAQGGLPGRGEGSLLKFSEEHAERSIVREMRVLVERFSENVRKEDFRDEASKGQNMEGDEKVCQNEKEHHIALWHQLQGSLEVAVGLGEACERGPVCGDEAKRLIGRKDMENVAGLQMVIIKVRSRAT